MKKVCYTNHLPVNILSNNALIFVRYIFRLVEEVGEINETVDSLKAKLREGENALQHLLRTKASLEQDLAIKNNSIFIDREKCMGMRKTFPMSPRVGSY